MSRGELGRAAFAVWAILSGVILLILLIPFVAPADFTTGLVPECEWKRKGKECPLCGMTKAFMAISKGEMEEAVEANRFSLWVYGSFVANECFLLAALATRIRRRRRLASTAVERSHAGVS